MGKSKSSPAQTTTNTYDPAYNAGMLALSQEQQSWSRAAFNMFQYGTPDGSPAPPGTTSEMQYLQQLVNANASLVGLQTAADRTSLEGQIALAPHEVAARQQQLQYQQALLPHEVGLRTQQINAESATLPYQMNATIAQLKSQIDLLPRETQNRLLQIESEMKINPHATAAQIAELQAISQLTPQRTATETAQHTAAQQLIPAETTNRLGQIEQESTLRPLQTQAESQRLGLLPQYYEDAFKGVDANKRMDQAQAGVQHGFKQANEAARIDLQSYGLDPSSGRYAALNRGASMAEATGIAGARTAAANQAEQEDFARKTTGLQMR